MNKKPTDEEIESYLDKAEEITDKLMERDGDEFFSYAYPLWIYLTRVLADMGWLPEQLGKDAERHATDQTSKGPTH